jgi:hypothetical protein
VFSKGIAGASSGCVAGAVSPGIASTRPVLVWHTSCQVCCRPSLCLPLPSFFLSRAALGGAASGPMSRGRMVPRAALLDRNAHVCVRVCRRRDVIKTRLPRGSRGSATHATTDESFLRRIAPLRNGSMYIINQKKVSCHRAV